MTTATAPVTWPSEESLASVQPVFNATFNATEQLVWSLETIVKGYMDEGIRPDPWPTLQTVGALYSFLETFRSELESIGAHADSLERLLREIDSIRLDEAARLRQEGDDA